MNVTRPQPRYLQIAEHLRELVAAGAPGARLPSETELCERFGVSRMTARQAVQLLVTEGLLYRRRGQGTFVGAPPVPRLLGSPLSFTASMRARGATAASRTLEARLIEPDPEHVQALRLGAGERVVLLERLRLADGVPMAVERAILAPDLTSVLDEDLDTTGLHATMEAMGRIPTQARARVSARLADGRERVLLELDPAGVLLCELRVITDQHDVPLEYTETRYAAARYAFEAVVRRDDTVDLG